MGLSIIIPSKNAANLVPCVQAIRSAGETCRIIVIDDGIDRDQWRSLSGGWGIFAGSPDIAEVLGHKPFVYARNINLGIYAAGADDVILLNDDALLQTPMGFAKMWDQSKRRPQYGVIAAACNNVGNPLQNLVPELADLDGVRNENRTLCFTCVLIPRRVIDAVGLLDERFVDYGMDDDDYCLRVRYHGLRLAIYDGCYCDHGSLTSSYRGGPQTGGNFHPNLRRFIAKWGTDNWGRSRDNSPFRDLWEGE
jgi:GT2 family glycosyltransferase